MITSLPKSIVPRKSKLQGLGAILKRGLLKSNTLRRKRLNIKANDAILSIVTDCREPDANQHSVLRSCREASRRMESILFSVGGAERIVSSLRYFKERPAVREIDHLSQIVSQNENFLQHETKQQKINAAIVQGLSGFLTMFGGQRSGRRSNENQNAYDAIMTALNTEEFTNAKLGRMLSRTLNVTHRQIKRGRAMRKSMEDLDTKRWLRKPSAIPKRAIGEGKC